MSDLAGREAPKAGLVFVVEDDVPVRESLTLLLRVHGYRAECFGSAEEFLALDELARPSCALVDIRLPGMSGLALQARIRQGRRGPPVLLMTAQGDAEIARTALLQGAADFLEKPIEEDQLLEAVGAALRSDEEQLGRNREHEALLARMAALTRHERELFERITNGRQSREIAVELGIPLSALEAQQGRLMEKLQARRLADLFRLRFRIGEQLTATHRSP